jgi:radical SAM superfamily enzyme YgiQ (UPF0313 family)
LRYKGMVIRPPSEAYSYILQATYGCSHNACTFCATYKGTRHQHRPLSEIYEDIGMAAQAMPHTTRVFLADGDALGRETNDLLEILSRLDLAFPNLERVGLYANAKDLLGKTLEELQELSRARLGIFYLGLESGDDEILKRVRKGATSDQMVEAVLKGRSAGMEASVIVLLGLGGKEGSRKHADLSADVVSRMQPEYVSALTLMVIPGTSLYKSMEKGEFVLPGSLEMLKELRVLVAGIDVPASVFRSNHASNYLPLRGVLSRDREPILRAIDGALANPEKLRPEFMRGL